MVQPSLQARRIEDGNQLPVDRKTRSRNEGMTGQECTKWLDDQVFGPLDRVHDQADDPAPRPDYHKLRPRRRGRAADSERLTGENHRDGLVAEQDTVAAPMEHRSRIGGSLL